MSYALYVGCGPNGPLEIFSALLVQRRGKGMGLEEATDDSYQQMRTILQVSNEKGNKVFIGYGKDLSFDDAFARFHPFPIYQRFASLVFETHPERVIAVDSHFDSTEKFRACAQSNGLGIEIKCMSLPRDDVNKDGMIYRLVENEGFPSLISGAHCLVAGGISKNFYEMGRGTARVWRAMPHRSLTRLIDRDTQLLTHEHLDLVAREGKGYLNALKGYRKVASDETVEVLDAIDGEITDEVGLGHFPFSAALLFGSADETRRSYSVKVISESDPKFDLASENPQCLVRVEVQH